MNALAPVMVVGPASDGSPSPCFVVLDAGEFSTRCRWCSWRSAQCSRLTDAQSAFRTHACPKGAVGSYASHEGAWPRPARLGRLDRPDGAGFPRLVPPREG